MPSWKKVITSGSVAALQSLTVTGGITGSLLGTSSWANNATTATTATNANNVAVTDTTTGTGPYYVMFADGTTGNRAVRVDSNNLTFNATTNTLTVANLIGTASWAANAVTASFVTGSNVFGPFGSNSILSSSFAVSSSRAVTSSFAITASFITTAQTASFVTTAQTASFVTGSNVFGPFGSNSIISASNALTASSVNTLNQSVLITGSLTVGSGSLGASENTVTLGARDTAGEGGQLGFNAPGGTYTSASMIDNYQNRFRLLRGTNAGSDAEFFSLNLHSGQAVLNRYTGSGAFPGSVTGILAVDSSGNILTTTAGGTGTVTQVNTSGTVNGITLTGGPITTTGTITLGGTLSNVQSSQLATSSLMIGNSSVSLGATASSLTGLTSVTATSFTGSFTGSHFGPLTGTASYATQALSASYAITASYVLQAVSSSFASTASFVTTAQTASFVTASNVYGPFGSNSIISASYAVSASSALQAVTASYALTSSFSLASSANTILVINKSGATISKGMVVHLTGSNNSSDTPYIITASYESDTLSANTLGIASQTITVNNTGYITTEGVLTGIDVTGLISGQVIYLGATGSITGSAPVAPLHAVRLGQVVRDSPSNNGAIYVRVDNGYELEELHNVLDTSTTSSYGDLLVRSGSVWTNSRQLTGSYRLTGSLNVTDTVQIGTVLVDHVSVNPTISGSNTIYTQATGSFTSAFMKYSVSSGSNTRAGEFMTAWNGTNIVYTDTSTTDIGNTAGVSFISSIVSSQLRVSASCTTSGWNIKTLSTFI